MCHVLRPDPQGGRDSLRSKGIQRPRLRLLPNQSLYRFQTFLIWCPANAPRFYAGQTLRARSSAPYQRLTVFHQRLMFDRVGNPLFHDPNVTNGHPTNRLCWVCNRALPRTHRSFWLGTRLSCPQSRPRGSNRHAQDVLYKAPVWFCAV